MEFIIFIGGVLVGASWTLYLKNHSGTKGIIDIDHDNNTYKIRMISKDVVDKRIWKATFLVNHDATISRDEQTL